MSVIDWALYSERAVGRGSVSYTDVINRPLREVMTISGQDPDASFPGFSLAGHTHDASAIVSGTLAPARGGTGLSSPAAGGLLVAAAAAAMTLLAPGASGQVVRSTGSAWASSPIVTADVSDLASAATGITRLGTVTTGAWQASPINDTYLATIGTAGKVANTATTAASANTPSAIVARDASGNFAAGVITATFTGALTGNASTATKLAAAVNINGVAFDGSGNVTVPAAANTLTGTTLAANVVASSLAGVGTLTSGTWSATLIAPAFGGTGVANGNTITVGGNVNTAAAFTTVGGALTLTLSGGTNVTLPTSGTLVNTAVIALSSLSTVGTLTAVTVTGTADLQGGVKVAGGTFAAGHSIFVSATTGLNILGHAGGSSTADLTLLNNQTLGQTVMDVPTGTLNARFYGTVTVAAALTATTGTFSSTINGQTISSAANFTGSVTATGVVAANAGVQIGGAATLATTATALLSYEAPITRIYVGDGTGYSTRFAKRVASVTTDLVIITDTGAVTVANGLTVSAGTTAVQALTATTGAFASSGNATVTNLSTFNGTTGTAAVNRNAFGNSSATDTFVIDVYGGGHATRPTQVWLNTRSAIATLVLATNDTAAITISAATQAVTLAGSLTANNGITVSAGGAFSSGAQLITSTLNGLFVIGKTGTGVGATDLVLANGLGGTVMDVPAGLTVARFAASAAAAASIRLPHGSAPTSPIDGDVWTTSAGVFARINGVTKTFTLT